MPACNLGTRTKGNQNLSTRRELNDAHLLLRAENARKPNAEVVIVDSCENQNCIFTFQSAPTAGANARGTPWLPVQQSKSHFKFSNFVVHEVNRLRPKFQRISNVLARPVGMNMHSHEHMSTCLSHVALPSAVPCPMLSRSLRAHRAEITHK